MSKGGLVEAIAKAISRELENHDVPEVEACAAIGFVYMLACDTSNITRERAVEVVQLIAAGVDISQDPVVS